MCALNEAQNLKKLLPNINCEMQKISPVKIDFEVILCLDGTTDESYNLISDLQKTFRIRALTPSNTLGLGCAYKRLFEDVIKNSKDDDIIISLDADNTHDPKQLAEIIEHFKKNNLDFLVASRFCKNSVMSDFPFYRKIISKTTSLVMQTIFSLKKISGKKLQDYSSGYRAYSAKALKELYKKHGNDFVTEKDFIYTCEILINLARNGCRLDEIALNYDYGQKIGKSKLNIAKNAKGLILLIAKKSIALTN